MPVTVKFDNTTGSPQQAQIIGDATQFRDGVMTTEQVAKLNSLEPVTLSDENPLPVVDAPAPGVSTEASRGDHVHPYPTYDLICSGGGVDQWSLLKIVRVDGVPSYQMLDIPGGDSPTLFVAVAKNAAGNDELCHGITRIGLATTMLSDGTGLITIADQLTPSATVKGRVMVGMTSIVGIAVTDALAVLDAHVDGLMPPINTQQRIVLSQAQRDTIVLPDPDFPPGTEIFNTDDNAPNYVSGDGTTWRDALGALT